VQTKESKLWNKIKLLKLKGQIFRIESNTINGIPDVYWLINGKSIWIELKANNIKNCNLSKWQFNWHLKHNTNGGRAFVLCLKPHLEWGFQILEVREPRTLVLLKSFQNLDEVFKFLAP